MWTKESQTDTSGAPEVQGSGTSVRQFRATASQRTNSSTAHERACLGSSLKIKGAITGMENVRIDRRVMGSISLQDHELTVGPTAELKFVSRHVK